MISQPSLLDTCCQSEGSVQFISYLETIQYCTFMLANRLANVSWCGKQQSALRYLG